MYNSYGATGDSIESACSVDPDLGTYDAFTDKNVRLGFIRKVLGIVAIQLIITILIGVAFYISDDMKRFTTDHPWMVWIALLVSLSSLVSLTCCNISRSFPGNLICLTIFTLTQALTIGYFTSFSNGEILLTAIGITTAVVIVLILFACQTRIDFTLANGALCCATLCLLLFGLATLIWPSKVILLIYASLGALIFSLWLVIDIQMLIGRNHAYQFSPEDYILASIIIYQDIINIFLNVLDIITLSTR